MPFPPDYHMHTPLCRHAVDEPTDYARRAVAMGVTEIGFSDHSPMARDNFDDWRMRFDQLAEYVAMVERARRDVPALTIRIGLEVDYIPGHEAWIRELAGRHAWDYFIGSVHYVSDDWDIDNQRKLAEWTNHDVWDVWALYFDRLTMAAGSGLFEIIGHPDLPKKFGHRPTRDVTPLYRRFLAAAKASGCVLDINTAGLRKPCREIYPSPAFLGLAREMGVPIAFGSDAHAAGEVGMNFAEAVVLARAVGYTESSRFEGRKATIAPF